MKNKANLNPEVGIEQLFALGTEVHKTGPMDVTPKVASPSGSPSKTYLTLALIEYNTPRYSCSPIQSKSTERDSFGIRARVHSRTEDRYAHIDFPLIGSEDEGVALLQRMTEKIMQGEYGLKIHDPLAQYKYSLIIS